MIHMLRCDFGDSRGQLDGRGVGALEEAVVVGQLQHLLVGGLSQFLAAVADIHAPQTGHAVEHLVAFAVPEIHALGALDDARAALTQLLVVGKGVQIVGGVHGLQFGGIEFAHTVLRFPWCRCPPAATVTGLRDQTDSSRNSRSQELITRL